MCLIMCSTVCRRRRAERIFPTRITLFQLIAHKIITSYRLSSDAILQILEEIEDDIESRIEMLTMYGIVGRERHLFPNELQV